MPQKIDAVIFDLHHTLSALHKSVVDVIRESAAQVGIDLTGVSDAMILNGIAKSDRWMGEYVREHDLDIHWGSQPEHWLGANRIMFREIGVDTPDSLLVKFEHAFHHETRFGEYEYITDDAKRILKYLHDSGIKISLCTRRSNDPSPVLERGGISHYFTSVYWTFVHGYSKPYPYTLILAAADMGVNPKNCMFVGNYVWLDMVAAQRAGMIPVLTVWANPEERKNATDGIIVIDSLLELRGIIEH